MFGIISRDDINEVGHSLFNNFRLALINYLQEEVKDINFISDLDTITTLLIVDEHYIPHKEIWQNDEFINYINSKNIKVVIFNFEKIFNSQFPWNIEIQNHVEKIKNRVQLVSDIKDASILNASIINKQLLSRSTILSNPILDKKDEILFLGQINEFYPTRSATLNELQKLNSKVRVIKTDRKYSYDEFLNLINNAKFILNPLGTGEFINLRFYEALSLGSIVVQQYTDEMEKWYPELNQPNVLKFKTAEDFININFNNTPPCKELYLEDYFEEINLKDLIGNI
jgi:hypothetical protein